MEGEPNEVNACHDAFLDHENNIIASDTCQHRIVKFVDNNFVAYSGLS
jgi:hypothetical protein